MRHAGAVVLVLAIALAACLPQTSPSPAPASPSPSGLPSATPGSTSQLPTDTPEPSPTPEPSLSLELPAGTDGRVVSVSVAPALDADGGEILVTVTSQAEDRIDELVLRWPTELDDSLFLAPFVPSDDRIREGGPPLVQAWTKWVVGPGEQGEPDGTTSLGYGPLLPGATLAIALDVTRRTDEPVAFDLQLLAGNHLLALAGGEPAELRVEVP